MALFHEQEFWFAIAFVVFVVSTFGPMKRALTGNLDTRAGKIRAELDEAKRLHAEAQALLDDLRKKQEQAKKDVEDILTSAREEAERMRLEGEEAAKRALAAREAQANDRIALAEQAALQVVRARAVDIAIRAATGLVAGSIDKDGAAALVDKAIDDLPKRAA
jgi:F-type H+-transporting ATPase subunit b